MKIPGWVDRAEYPFEPRLIDVGAGESLSVIDEGSGPPVVFSHGTPTWSFEWRHLVKALCGTHRCIAPDHLGFGLSPRPADADYSPEAHAARFGRLLDRLDLGRFSLVAHDFGGPIALDAALERVDRLERVVLFNTIAWPFTDTGARAAKLAGSGLFRWLYRPLNLSFVISRSAWGRGPRPAAMWRQYTQVFPDADSRERVLFALARSLAGSTAFFQSLWDRRARLANTPLQIIWGLADNAFTPDVLERFRQCWPHAQVTTLPRAGHWPHEEEAAVCSEAVQAFLSQPSQG